jgi:reductive dehalogenase
MFSILSLFLLAATDAGLLLLLATSWREKERRASLLAALFFVVNTLLWAFFVAHSSWPAVRVASGAAFLLFLAGLIVSFIRTFSRQSIIEPNGHSIRPYDERDHMFSRNELKFHPELARRYYQVHPERKGTDRAIHSKPEIGQPGQVYHHPLLSPAFEAAFDYLDRIRPATKGQAEPDTVSVDPDQAASLIRRLAFFYGAADVGFAKVKPYHLYSHQGRHAQHWGEAVSLGHTNAVVVIMAMDPKMIKKAPSLSVILESSRSYVEAARVASLLAGYLRRLGYEARAHTDANYLALCVPLAAEAGLGEVGRMGLLLHPRLGPCLRISLVTTDLELPTTRRRFFQAERFCRICRKCAENCPARAIPGGEKTVSRGASRWTIIQEKCYSYWKSVGSDCSVCIRVCPYTKPATLLHRMARIYVSRNALNQRVALFLDDLLYGRRPALPASNFEDPLLG